MSQTVVEAAGIQRNLMEGKLEPYTNASALYLLGAKDPQAKVPRNINLIVPLLMLMSGSMVLDVFSHDSAASIIVVYNPFLDAGLAYWHPPSGALQVLGVVTASSFKDDTSEKKPSNIVIARATAVAKGAKAVAATSDGAQFVSFFRKTGNDRRTRSALASRSRGYAARLKNLTPQQKRLPDDLSGITGCLAINNDWPKCSHGFSFAQATDQKVFLDHVHAYRSAFSRKGFRVGYVELDGDAEIVALGNYHAQGEMIVFIVRNSIIQKANFVNLALLSIE